MTKTINLDALFSDAELPSATPAATSTTPRNTSTTATTGTSRRPWARRRRTSSTTGPATGPLCGDESPVRHLH